MDLKTALSLVHQSGFDSGTHAIFTTYRDEKAGEKVDYMSRINYEFKDGFIKIFPAQEKFDGHFKSLKANPGCDLSLVKMDAKWKPVWKIYLHCKYDSAEDIFIILEPKLMRFNGDDGFSKMHHF